MRTPIHPGEILKEELDCLEMSSSKFAEILKVPTNRITQIINGQRSISPDTALRLSLFFGTTALYWMNLQALYEIDKENVKDKTIDRKSIPYYKDIGLPGTIQA